MNKYIDVKPGSIPGVTVRDGTAYYEVAGREYPIIAFVKDENLGYLPVVDFPQMSDEQWDKLTREKKEAAQRADGTESGKVEQGFPNTVSVSYHTGKGENLQA